MQLHLITRLTNHISQMAPHQRDRQAGKLLVESRDRIAELEAIVDKPPKTAGLSFDLLRLKNDERGKEWGVNELPATFASTELAGEVGEACNEVKKLERQRAGIPGGKDSTDGLADELGDVVICADLLASRYGIDLGQAIKKKFNKTSDKHGFSVKL